MAPLPIYHSIDDYLESDLHHSHVVAVPCTAPWRCVRCEHDQPGRTARLWQHITPACLLGRAGGHPPPITYRPGPLRCLRGPLCPHCAEGVCL